MAATSARLLAEAAVRDAWQVAACDLYGDADTRAASDAWWSLASTDAPQSTALDAGRLIAALGDEARRGAVGWVAGSGFDGRPDVLEAGRRILPLIGATPDAVRRLRDPRWFFACLQAHGIAHPPVAFEAPASPDGWLRKDAANTGGWGVVEAGAAVDAAAMPRTRYWQRAQAGRPMSATFLAAAGDVVVLSHNRQWTCRIGVRPYVHCGLVGPVGVEPDVARQVAHACRVLSTAAGLRGLASLDVLLAADGAVRVLELNPRPSASIAVCAGGAFGDASAGGGRTGVFDAHVDAAGSDALPKGVWCGPDVAMGLRTVYVPGTMTLTRRHLDLLGNWPDCHDRPAVPLSLRRGDPLCSLSATRARFEAAEQVADLLFARLAADRQRLLVALEPQQERP